MNKQDFFIPENKTSEIEHISPSGKYRLVIEYFKTGKNTWQYSQGTVYKGQQVIGLIQRNYSSFPFLWIENHPNGHDYFIGGENYQGQTVIELDTGIRRDLLPEEAKQGNGFCWSSYKYIPEHQVLLVHGCYWAASYEFRFYDFRDPMNGWPQISEDLYIEDSQKRPTIDSDGVITTYQTVEELEFEDQYPDQDMSTFSWEKPDYGLDDEIITIVATKEYLLKDGKITFLEEYVSTMEAEYREQCKINEEKYYAWKKEFTETDPLYLAFIDECKKLGLDEHMWAGYTYDDWCPGYTFNEGRWGKDIYNKDSNRITIEWGIKTGPVRIEIIKNNKKEETKFWMEHSAESVRLAFEYAKERM